MVSVVELLKQAKEAGASDLHITVGIPPKMRVNGKLITMDYPRMMPDNTMEALLEVMNEQQRLKFEEKGELDMVYTLNPLIKDVRVRILNKKRERMGFYVSPGHPLAGKTIREEDLKDVPLLLTGHTCSLRHMLVDDLENSGITPNIVLETSSKEILKQFAAGGFGVAFIPDMTAEAETKNGKLKRLVWKGTDFPVYSQVLIHKDKHQNKAIDHLVDHIRNC